MLRHATFRGRRGCARDIRQSAARPLARHGDVRPRRRHVADERFDLLGRQRSRHDGQRGPVGDRTRSAGVGRVHPDRKQGRRSHRTQEGVRPRTPGLCHRRPRHGARAEPRRGHHLLGDHRRPRRIAPAPRDAVTHPRQLRGRRPEEGLRTGGRVRRHRRSGGTAARRIHHDLPVVARRVLAGRRGDRRRVVRHQARPRCAVHGRPARRRDRSGPLRGRHGRHRPQRARVAGGRRGRRCADGDRRRCARGVRLLARVAQAAGEADADRSGPVQVQGLPLRDHGPDAPADRVGRNDDRAADLPADGARVQRDAGRIVACAALADDVRDGARRRERRREHGGRAPSSGWGSR